MSVIAPTEDLAAIVQQGASRPFRKWLIISIICALAIGGGAYYYFHQETEHDVQEYVTEPLEQGDISLIITASGRLAPTNDILIGSELSGTVQEVLVDTNDNVKKGQPLAKLDTSKLNQQTERTRAALLAAKARVQQVEATLQETQASFARQEELLQISGGKTPSKATMETSRASVARAKADLESAKAAVAGAEAEVRAFERDLEKTVIRSPVDGVVLTRSIEVGQTVAASFTAPLLFTIAEDLKKMELAVSVPEADIGRIAVGQTATFNVDAWPTRSYTASVKKVSFGTTGAATAAGAANNAVANGVVTYSTELEVANEDLSLRPGMTATVDISITSKKNIWRVRNSALRFDPAIAAEIGKPSETKKTLVQQLSPGPGRRLGRAAAIPTTISSGSDKPHFWILKDNKPVEIIVEIGITDGLFTEITGENLSDDMQVILNIKPTAAP